MKTSKQQSIKAWAVLHTNRWGDAMEFSEELIDTADHFVDSDCVCCQSTEAMAIYEKKREAYGMANYYLKTHKNQFRVVPVLVTFPSPKKPEHKPKQ